MKFDDSEYTFEAPAVVSRARRILIKPCANSAAAYPVTTSRDILASIINGIRKVSDADIVILEGTPDGSPVMPIFQSLGYDFPRVVMLDVRDSVWVEVDNPLPKPLIMPTFWIPNVILSSDYLISVTPAKVVKNQSWLSIMNLLSLLPAKKYSSAKGNWTELYALGIDKVIADLYYTLPFDLGIIEARQKLVSDDNPLIGKVENMGKVFVGDPLEIDREVSEMLTTKNEYLELIRLAESGLDII
ncbi:MAG TPA: DUF362 domain-containing protein [Dehalococcoidales bacterium]|nr:DUF362 domain-containing protein [Dehalococcoidales bacterium]